MPCPWLLLSSTQRRVSETLKFSAHHGSLEHSCKMYYIYGMNVNMSNPNRPTQVAFEATAASTDVSKWTFWCRVGWLRVQPLRWILNRMQMKLLAERQRESPCHMSRAIITVRWRFPSMCFITCGWRGCSNLWCISCILIQWYSHNLLRECRNIWPLWMGDLHSHSLPLASSRSLGIDLLTDYAFTLPQLRHSRELARYSDQPQKRNAFIFILMHHHQVQSNPGKP